MWEMRCPKAWECVQANPLINKKTSRERAVQGLARHLHDQTQHSSMTWEEALDLADNDAYITVNTCLYTVLVDSDGEEFPNEQHKGKTKSVDKGKGKGQVNPKGGETSHETSSSSSGSISLSHAQIQEIMHGIDNAFSAAAQAMQQCEEAARILLQRVGVRPWMPNPSECRANAKRARRW